ncbi:MAG: prolyl aminopeptidase [Elusimicrobia bacterium]|nr:prolyl aminopeptidase [Elusimicrobiota bacterium]
MALKNFYPPQKAYREGKLRVSLLHSIYFEESGNPKGKPVLYLHGGPGAGTSPSNRQYFHPKKWRLVMFDQRGCGKSTPHAELRENTTWDLVADIEKLRRHLGIEKWVIFGGSWGSTLALAYAEKYPERCKALILRGIFLCRRSELEWFYQQGANHLFPDLWEDYLKPIPAAERKDMMRAYYKRLTSPNKKIRLEAARAWSAWEGKTLFLNPDPKFFKKWSGDKFVEAIARIESHYFVNNCWFKRDDQLLADAHRLRKIPGVIIHGRYDVICPLSSAWALHRQWPQAKFQIIPAAGHTAYEPGIRSALIEWVDRFHRLA